MINLRKFIRIDISNQELSEFVAETQGWVKIGAHLWRGPSGGAVSESNLPRYADSADLVLPFAEKYTAVVEWHDSWKRKPGRCCRVEIFWWEGRRKNDAASRSCEIVAETFPRAMCFAVLEVHGFTVMGTDEG